MMGRKRNLRVEDENSNMKKKEEVVIKADSVIELVNLLSSGLISKSVPSIFINYEGKENMDELIPHLLHSVAVDDQLASDIKQSLGIELYPSYEDWYTSIDEIESEISRIHENNNNEESVSVPNVPLPLSSSSQSPKTVSGKERRGSGTESGNSSMNPDIFGVPELSYTDMDIDALFMDILSSSSNCLLDGDKVFEGLPDLPTSASLPPLPLSIVGQPLELKPFAHGDCDSVVTNDVLPTKATLHAKNELNHDPEPSTSKLSPENESGTLVGTDARSSQTPSTSMYSPAEIKSDLNNDISAPRNLKKLPRCTIDIKRVNNPLAVVFESLESKEVATDAVKAVQICDKIDDLENDCIANGGDSTASNLESEQNSHLVQNSTKVNDGDGLTEKPTLKQVPLSRPKTRSRSKIVDSESEILQLIEMADSDAENKSTEEEEDSEGDLDDLKNIQTAEQGNNNSSVVWQPSVVLERIDSSKLAQKKIQKKVTPHQVRRCIANMKNFVKSEKPDIQQINEAMETTFSWRRKMVIDPAISIHAVLKEFPALSLFEVVKCECDRLLGDKLKTLENLLEENFLRAANSRKIKSPHKLFIDARKAFKKGGSVEMKKISGMVCLAFYLAEKQAVGSLFQLQTKKKKVVSKLTPMMILEEEDLFTENREIRIFADGTEMLKVPNFYEGVLTIYSLYYVLDIIYDKNVTLLFQYFDFLIGLPQSSFSTEAE